MSPRVSRLTAYGLISAGLAAAVVGSALKTRPNFYAAAVSVGRSNGSLMVLANFVLWLSIMCGVLFKNIFFGELRPIEYEHLFERLWIFVTESLFAFTIFRGDFTLPFALLYDFLVFLKCFHWITADRIDYLDQVPPPGPPMAYHVRMATVTSLLTAFDIVLLYYSTESVLIDGPSAMILFASEFAILFASIVGIWARYIIGLIDLRRAGGRADAPPWEEKSMYLFYVDLAVDFSKLLTYLVFFVVIFLNYGFPIHILRDVYMTLRSFLARGTDLVRYRRATRNMDQLYPDATPEELANMGDRTCIICREEMVARGAPAAGEAGGATEGGEGEAAAEPAGAGAGAGTGADAEADPQRAPDGPNETPKKLTCGHVFHFHCLRSWLERQQSCPTCRRDVLTNGPPAAAAAPPPAAQPQAGAEAAAGAAEARGPAGDEHDRMRAMFEDYFRHAGVNGDPPMPVPPPAADEASRAGTPAEREDARVQRSIWGAPITPGDFNVRPPPPPLGSTQRWPDAGPSRLRPANGSVAASGTSTPQASRPPAVFSSTGVPRPSRQVEMTEEAEEAEALAVAEALSEPDADDVEDVMPLREALAAAALRRAGLTADKGKGRAEEVVELGDSSAPVPAAATFDDPPTHRAYLTSPGDARAMLEERLRVLRGVDETVWGLVSELSRLKSKWEAEDGVERERT